MRITPFLRSLSNTCRPLALVAIAGLSCSPAAAAPVDAVRDAPRRVASLAPHDAAQWKKDTTYGPVRDGRVFPGVEAILYGDGPTRKGDFKWPYEPRTPRPHVSPSKAGERAP
jgi:hypothetical protein